MPVDLLNSLPSVGVNGAILRDGLELNHLVAVDRLVMREAYWPAFLAAPGRRWLYKPYYQKVADDLQPGDVLFNQSNVGFYLDGDQWHGLYTCISVIGPAIHLAFLLGYHRVILVGVDCGLVNGAKHFYGRTINHAPASLDKVASRIHLIEGWLPADRSLVTLMGAGAAIGLPIIAL